MDSKKRSRSCNWGYDEKETLLFLVRERIDIIENKTADGRMIAKKNYAWEEVKKEFEALHGERELRRLKEQWRRMKMQSKDSIRTLQQYQRGTGGGGPVPENVALPTKQDLEIQELIPKQFLKDSNFADDDGDQDQLEIVIYEDPVGVEDKSAVNQPSTCSQVTDNDVIETMEIHVEAVGSGSAAEVQEIPSRKKKIVEKGRKMSSYEEAMLEQQKLRMEEQMKQIKRRKEMDEELHKLQLEQRKLENNILDLKLQKNKYKVMYWKKKFESLQ